MQNIQDKAEELSVQVTDYIKILYQLGTVRVTEKTANSAAVAITAFTIVFFALIVLLIGGIGLGWWLGTIIDNMAGGFFIVAGFYLLCLIIIVLLRKKLLFPMIRNRIIRKIYE